MLNSNNAYLSHILLSILSILLIACSQAQKVDVKAQEVWVPDNGDGTYKNPIIFADYSDPDVIRVGDDFYMVSSSFNASPGMPVLHSKDLVNWKIINHVFQKQNPDSAFSKPQHGNGCWAPSIRYHDGYFWIYFGDPDYGIYMTKAKDPADTWEPLHLVRAAKGWIDPCPFWDDDGNAYLVHAWARSRSGINSILTINRMNPDGRKLLDDGTLVFDGHAHHPTIEGPKLYKRNGYYYIFAPAGGVKPGWQTVLRSKNIFGPYEDKIVLEQGSTDINGPHQGGWVELKSGESWFIHFQDRGAYGRIVHLEPMKWVNDWPQMGKDLDGNGIGEPVSTWKKPDVGKNYPVETPQTNDEFSDSTLGLQWQWQANYKTYWWSLTQNSGNLRLFEENMPAGSNNLFPVPNLCLQKLPAPVFQVTTLITPQFNNNGEQAGLIVFGLDYAFIGVEKNSSGYMVVRKTCIDAEHGAKEILEASEDLSAKNVYLRVTVNDSALCSFSYSLDGKIFNTMGTVFKAREGKWVGAKVGLFATSPQGTINNGHADFDFFRFQQ